MRMSELDDFLAEIEDLAAQPPPPDDGPADLVPAVPQASVGTAKAGISGASDSGHHISAKDVDDEDEITNTVPEQANTSQQQTAKPKSFFAPRQVVKAAAAKPVLAVSSKAVPMKPVTGPAYDPSAYASTSSGSAAAAALPVRSGSATTSAVDQSETFAYGSAYTAQAPSGSGNMPYVAPAVVSSGAGESAGVKRSIIRVSAGESWVDTSLAEWPDNDFRLWCGDLGHDVTDDMLAAPFKKYRSFVKAKMVQERHKPGKTKGYGFVSFMDPYDGLAAMKEVNGQHIGLRPVRIKKSNWEDRSVDVYRAKEKERAKRMAMGLPG